MSGRAIVIRTPDQRVRVFVSSTLRELAPGRRVARAVIERLALAPVMFELGARPHPPRTLDRACLEQSDIFVGVYWESYGWVAPDEEMAALIGGEQDPKILVQMARSRMRKKIAQLEEGFTGHFDDHHRFLLSRTLGRIDAIDVDIGAVDEQIEEHLAPFGNTAARLGEIPGIGPATAVFIIAEIGIDTSRFRTPGHLITWAKFAPGVKNSAGKDKDNGSTGNGNRYLARALAKQRSAPARPTPSSAPSTGARHSILDVENHSWIEGDVQLMHGRSTPSEPERSIHPETVYWHRMWATVATGGA